MKRFKLNIFCVALTVLSACSLKDKDVALMEESLAALPDPKVIESKVQNTNATTYQDIIEIIRPYEIFLNKLKSVGDFQFKATYQPHVLLSIKNKPDLDLNRLIDKTVLKHSSDYSSLHYINFQLENTAFNSELLRYNLESTQEYSDRIMYYSFYCNKDVVLIENGVDTLRGAFVHFERTFDVSPTLNLTFVFERKNSLPLNKLNFVFDDLIFNNGKLNFEFDYQVFSILNSKEINKMLL